MRRSASMLGSCLQCVIGVDDCLDPRPCACSSVPGEEIAPLPKLGVAIIKMTEPKEVTEV